MIVILFDKDLAGQIPLKPDTELTFGERDIILREEIYSLALITTLKDSSFES